MSVIYDALIKRKNTGDKKPEPAVSRGNVLIFDDLLKKNAIPTLLLFMLIVFAVAGGLYYLYQYEAIPHKITAATPADPEVVAAQSIANESVESNSAPTTEGQQENGAEDTEDIVVAHISTTEIPEEPTGFPEKVVTGKENNLRADTKISSRKASLETIKNSPVVMAVEDETAAENRRSETQPVLVVAPKTVTRSATMIDPEIKGISRPARQVLQPKSDPANINRNVTPASREISNKILPSAATETAPVAAVKARKQQPKSLSGNDKKNFNPAIQTLNRELQQSIAQHDFAAGHEILKKLEGFLGADSIYILKLKAYFHLQNNQFESAHRILVRVLENDVTDLEAGLNMIVVLVQRGEIKAAQRQIDFLLNYYPENQSLLHFKQQTGN